jgi:uncharacterized protein
MHVASLHIYPVKSTAPTDLDQTDVEACGLTGDRRWLVVDPDGVQMTARERRRLLHVKAQPGADGTITLTGPHAPPLQVAGSELTATASAEVWQTRFPVVDAGEPAARWFSELLDEPARLVNLDDPAARPITHPNGRPGEVVSMADSYPLLLTSTASLARLNEWITTDHSDDAIAALPMRRFRPNVVLDAPEPFAEDDWKTIRIGAVTFRSGGPSSRCVLTTVDPETLRNGKEPIRTLARRHSWDHKTYFGVNLVPTTLGQISVGDPVEILD